MSYCGISFKNNPEQQELARLIADHSKQIIFCTGQAGTGKTFATLATALQMRQDKIIDKILYGRDAIQLGADMGFLPGDVNDKYSPFMAPLYDNLESLSHINHYNINDMKSKIEITPIAFLRGRNLDNCILIIDEAQNLDLITLKAILTRIGTFGKVVLLGSLNQIDNPKQMRKEKCDFIKVMEALESLPYVAKIELKQSMRSTICAEVDEILSRLN